VAHEINNPINFIYANIPYVDTYVKDLLRLLNAYQVRSPQPDAELQALLEEIDVAFLLRDLPQILNSMRSGADRIRQIVLTLRNFSRLDEASLKAVDLHQGIESTLAVLKPELEEIEVIRQYGMLPLVECFPSQINQVFMNLIINSIEALRQWHGPNKTIAICSDFIPANQHYPALARIVIADNGPGISHEIQAKIFDPFFTTKDVGEGTGLGLTMSYQTVVNQHKGNLKFYSEPGLGAEFLVEIPIQHQEGSSLIATEEAIEPSLDRDKSATAQIVIEAGN
jgi:signal transduction histidine kinase